MYTLFGLIVLVLDVIAIIDVAMSGREMTKKVLWIVLILILPLVGMILYFLLGRSKAAL